MKENKALKVNCNLENSLLPSINEFESHYDEKYNLSYLLSQYPLLEDLSIVVDTYLHICIRGSKELANSLKLMKNLKNLSLSIEWFNEIGSGCIDIGESLGQLTQLRVLKLSIHHLNRVCTKIFIPLANSISNLINLQSLDLEFGKNRIHSSGLSELALTFQKLINLKDLSLKFQDNKIVLVVGMEKIAESFKYLSNLQRLTLYIQEQTSDCVATKVLCNGFQYLKSLIFLSLTFKYVIQVEGTIGILAGINQIKQLQHLYLYLGQGIFMCPDPDQLIDKCFDRLDNLKYFKFIQYHNYFQFGQLIYLGNFISSFPNLKELDFVYPDLQSFDTDRYLSFLENMKSLNSLETLKLNIYNKKCDIIHESIGKTIQNLFNLKQLNLKLLIRRGSANNVALLNLGNALKNLQQLKDFSLKLIIDDQFSMLEEIKVLMIGIKECKSLKRLKLSFSTWQRLSDEELNFFFDNLKFYTSLSELNIRPLNLIKKIDNTLLLKSLLALENITSLKLSVYQRYDAIETIFFFQQLQQLKLLHTLQLNSLINDKPNKQKIKQIIIRKYLRLIHITI